MDTVKIILDKVIAASDALVYIAIAVMFVIGIIRCIAPVASNRRALSRAIARVRSGETRTDWQEDHFLGKGSLLPHWEAYLKNLFFADGAYHDASSVEDYINEETVIEGPGRRAFADGIPGLLVSLGFMGTLIGLVNGLSGFDMSDSAAVQQSILTLVPGMRYAFMTSIAGVVASVSFTIMVKWVNGSTEKTIREFYSAMNRYAGAEAVDPMTQITIYQQEQTALIQTMAKDLNGRFTENISNVIQDAMKPMEKALHDYVTVSSKEQMRFLDAIAQRFVDRMQDCLGQSFQKLGQTIETIAVKESAAFASTDSALREIRRLMDETQDIHRQMSAVSQEWTKYMVTLTDSRKAEQELVSLVKKDAESMALVSERQGKCLLEMGGVVEKLENIAAELEEQQKELATGAQQKTFREDLLNAVWDVRDEIIRMEEDMAQACDGGQPNH